MNDNHDGSGFTAGLLLGLVTGAASAHFLMNTEKGKELLATLKDNAGDAIKELGDNPLIADKIADLQKTMDRARATINTAAEKVAMPRNQKPAKELLSKSAPLIGQECRIDMGRSGCILVILFLTPITRECWCSDSFRIKHLIA